MLFALEACAYLVGIPLEALVIAAMLKGPYRRFPLVFAYIVALLLVTLVEVPLLFLGYFSDTGARALYVRAYWIDERILMGLVFAVVISLVYKASEQLPTRRILRAGLIGGAALFAGLSFWIHYNPALKPGEWMTPWTSNLNFCAALMDLALWALLIAQPRKDVQLLMLSGGLGIQFTGAAIGEAIRNMSQQGHSVLIAYAGSVVVALTNLAFLYIWRQSLRQKTGATDAVSAGK